MAGSKILFFHFLCFFIFLSLFQGERQVLVEGSRSKIGFKPKKLFVFGDSYADTGNNAISLSSSWKVPYGVTFPGKPAGRFSDGRVLTDFFAKFLEIKTPIAYRWRNLWGRSHLKYGINFAAGGTGVFDTLFPGPNMTTQINFFQGVLSSGDFTKWKLISSVALVTVSGNDYSTYISRNGSAQMVSDRCVFYDVIWYLPAFFGQSFVQQFGPISNTGSCSAYTLDSHGIWTDGQADGFPAFIKKVVNQIEVNLKRIHDSGVKKVVVSALQPLGCLPTSTIKLSFQQCNATENALVALHNQYLNQAVAKLNAESNSSSFVVLDLNEAFFTVFRQNELHQGTPSFVNQYKPCCLPTSTQYSCGSVDTQGTKMYTVCADPGSSFFWDGVHPTQAGWNAVYKTLAIQNTLKQL